MTERPDDLSFASPGPGAAASGTGGPDEAGSRPVPGAPGHVVAPSPASPVPPGERWGAPGGPTAAERAAARRSARNWVIAVLTVIVLVVGLAAGISAAVSRAHERAWTPVAADAARPATVNAVQLVLGSCLATAPSSDVVTTAEVVPCADPHRAQVVGRTDAAPDAVWPGDEAVARRAARACTTDLLGPVARESGAEVALVVWTPTEESWDDGDRAGLCLAVVDAEVTGSLLE